MALRTDKAVEIFTAMNLGKIKDSEIEVAEARSAMQELAKNPSPNNRYEIAQLIAFTVNDILEQQTNFVETFADVQNVGLDEKAYFDIELDGIQAFIQAKGATTQRSKVLTKKITIDTDAVSARPVVDFISLAQGKVNFDAIINDAAFKMQNAKLARIQNVLYNAMKLYADPNYNTGSGIVPATIDPMIVAFSRLGQVSLVGDLAVVSKLGKLTGWTGGAFSQDLVNQQNQNGFIGTYNGASVTKLVNPFVQHSLTQTYLKKNLIYVLPSGMAALRPLKVVNEGNIIPMENTNIDDRSFEVRLDQHFGAAVVVGSVAYMGMYEDSSVTA